MSITPEQTEEITRLRDTLHQTRRATVPALEEILYHPFPVLDHGFLRVIDYMGDDAAVTQAARVSYGRGTKKVSEDAGLIRYLMRHWHCYHPDMEVLTSDGWKCWKDCAQTETFMVPNPVTKDLTLETLSVVSFDMDGEVYRYENDRMSYCVTPDHKMYFKGKYAQEFSAVKAGEMSGWGHFESTIGYKLVTPEGDMDALYQMIGFFLGDGMLCSTNRISFNLAKSRKLDYLENLLVALKWPAVRRLRKNGEGRLDSQHYTVEFDGKFRQALDLIGANTRSENKSFNLKKLKDLSSSEVRGLWDGLVNSDGHVSQNRERIEFSSRSSDLLKLFETVAAMLGYDGHRNGKVGVVYAYTGGRTSLESRAEYHSTIEYAGKVFCATTSTGWLVVRGGPSKFAFVCGNSTPFEMASIKYHVKLPIFVARQWIRHRAASVNEYSGRYSILDNEFYIPAPEQLSAQSTVNRQGRGEVLEGVTAAHVLDLLRDDATRAYEHYEEMLSPDTNLARELARMNLSLNFYTQWYWKVNLHNKMNFLRLRADSHAQYEIRVYAQVMQDILERWVPMTAEAFKEYRQGGAHLSASGLGVVKRMLAGEVVTQDASGMSKREWRELMEQIGRGE